MANQANYVEQITTLINNRPFRPSSEHHIRLNSGDKNVFFGTHPEDNIELWVYTARGRVAGYQILPITDPNINLYTIADGPRAGEYISLRLDNIFQNMGLPSGRYSIVANIFRNEIGSMFGDRMVIDKISPTRTEVRLRPEDRTEKILEQIYEFTTPSVPRVKAQALLDQVFGKELESGGQARVNTVVIRNELDNMAQGTDQRLVVSGAVDALSPILEKIKQKTYTKALELLREDIYNYQVQEEEFLEYIRKALSEVLSTMEELNEIDPRLELV